MRERGKRPYENLESAGNFFVWSHCGNWGCRDRTRTPQTYQPCQHRHKSPAPQGPHGQCARQSVRRQGEGGEDGTRRRAAAYFPSGSIWTQDISHAPLDPQSSAIIAWLAEAGGWGNNNKMHTDFSIRVLQADATTPYVRFKGPGPNFVDSDQLSTFPLPDGGGIEGQSGYQCPVDQGDCHLIVVDRSHGKLYEAYQANYADNVLTAA
jgi:hypothetical protein